MNTKQWENVLTCKLRVCVSESVDFYVDNHDDVHIDDDVEVYVY